MDVTYSDEKGPKADSLPKPDHFISAFIKAKSDLLIYPPTNPVVKESVVKAISVLREHYASEMLEIEIEKERILLNGEAAGSTDTRVGKLSLGLYRRGIRKMILDPAIRADEMRLFLDTLNMKIEDIAEAGGVAALMQNRKIARVTVEGTSELTIVDGANLPVLDEIASDIDGIEDIDIDFELLDSPESVSKMFVSVGETDVKSIMRLRKLLEKPEVFTQMLERCVEQIRGMDGEVDIGARVQQVLDILQTLGSVIASMPSDDERSQMLRNMAVSVLGLSANLRTELVNHGLIPNLALKRIESGILSRFPITQLADALLENFHLNDGVATVLEGYLDGLDLEKSDREALNETLHQRLEQSGDLTPELGMVLMVETVRVSADAVDKEYVPPDLEKARMDFDVPNVEGYPTEKILFDRGERGKLINEISDELGSPAALAMAPMLLDMLGYERSPINHAALIERIVSYLDLFLSQRNYEMTAQLIKGLQADRAGKEGVFSSIQLKPLDDAIEKYVGKQGIRRLIADFKNMKAESKEFQRIIDYFSSLGEPAIRTLLHSLDDEESRHVRLLTCKALAQMGDVAVGVVAERLDSPQWFVARNVASILGDIGTAACVPHLQKALSHSELRVRRQALKGLASVKTDEAVELVCACAREDDVETCKAALGWLAIMRAPQALDALEHILESESVWKKEDEVIRLAIEALGAIKTKPATALLEKLSRSRKWVFHRKKAALVRQAAAAALGGRKRK